MIKEPKAMKEIHDIRLAIFEEMKGLSLHEKFMRIKESADRDGGSFKKSLEKEK